MTKGPQQCVVVFSDEDANRRAARQTSFFYRPAAIGQHFVPGRRQRCEMGHLAAGDERVRGVLRQTEDVFQPLRDHLFNDGGRGRAGVGRGVLVPGRGQPVGGDGDRDSTADHPAEEAAAGTVQEAVFGILGEFLDDLRPRQALGGELLVESGPEGLRIGLLADLVGAERLDVFGGELGGELEFGVHARDLGSWGKAVADCRDGLEYWAHTCYSLFRY